MDVFSLSLSLPGWVRILHEMALDKENIVYSLLASTILANLDRPKLEKFVEKMTDKE